MFLKKTCDNCGRYVLDEWEDRECVLQVAHVCKQSKNLLSKKLKSFWIRIGGADGGM